MTIEKKHILEKITEFKNEIVSLSPELEGKSENEIYSHFFYERDYYGPVNTKFEIFARPIALDGLPSEFLDYLDSKTE